MEIELAVALVLPAILAFLQLLCQGGSGVEGSHTISLSVTIALVSLSASMPLPSNKFLKLSFSCIILACASVLSSSVSHKLRWLPYISGIRPFYHLLPNQFQTLLTKAYQHMRAAIEVPLAISGANLVASAPSGSSSSQPNLNLQEVIVDAHTSSPSTSTETQLELGSVSESTSDN